MATIEQKAKAYDEAIERAKKWRNAPNIDKIPTFGNRVIEEIFPELCESEDEKIKQKIIRLIKMSNEVGGFALHKWEADEMLAWLEKQGEQNHIEQNPEMVEALRTEYEKGRADAIAQMQNEWDSKDSFILKSAIALLKHPVLIEKNEDIKNRVVERLKSLIPQQKQEWSEEDEKIREAICYILNHSASGLIDNTNFTVSQMEDWLEKHGEQKPVDKVEPFDKYEGLTDFERTLADICIGWIGQELGWKQYIKDNADILLKIAVKKFNSVQNAPFERLNSIKQRYTWKPSDEQMEAFEHFVRSIGESGYASPYENNIKLLYSLLNDLKKLKE